MNLPVRYVDNTYTKKIKENVSHNIKDSFLLLNNFF